MVSALLRINDLLLSAGTMLTNIEIGCVTVEVVRIIALNLTLR